MDRVEWGSSGWRYGSDSCCSAKRATVERDRAARAGRADLRSSSGILICAGSFRGRDYPVQALRPMK